MKAAVWALLIVMAALARPAWAQQLGQGSDAGSVSMAQIVGLLLFLGLLGVAAWAILRMRGAPLKIWTNPGEKQVQIVELARLSPTNILCLARWNDKEYLIAFTAQGAQLVDTRIADAPEEAG